MAFATQAKRVSVIRIPRNEVSSGNFAFETAQGFKKISPNEENTRIQSSPSITESERAGSASKFDESFQNRTELFMTTTNKEASNENREKTSPNSSRSKLIVKEQAQKFITVRPSSDHRTRPFLNWKGEEKWQHGVCSCFDDFNMCCFAFCCWCCFRYELTKMMGEGCPVCCCDCNAVMHLRTKFRQQYRIRVKYNLSI